jgi:hypothetical protein
MESLERVFPLEVCGVVSRRFEVGNTAGEYTGCGSSPHYANFCGGPLYDPAIYSNILPFNIFKHEAILSSIQPTFS